MTYFMSSGSLNCNTVVSSPSMHHPVEPDTHNDDDDDNDDIDGSCYRGS